MDLATGEEKGRPLKKRDFNQVKYVEFWFKKRPSRPCHKAKDVLPRIFMRRGRGSGGKEWGAVNFRKQRERLCLKIQRSRKG